MSFSFSAQLIRFQKIVIDLPLLMIAVLLVVTFPARRLVLCEQIWVATREVRAAFIVNIVMIGPPHRPFEGLDTGALSVLSALFGGHH